MSYRFGKEKSIDGESNKGKNLILISSPSDMPELGFNLSRASSQGNYNRGNSISNLFQSFQQPQERY